MITSYTAAGVDQYGTPMIDNQAVPPTEHRSPHPGMYSVYNYIQ